jgi:hypothetical protein
MEKVVGKTAPDADGVAHDVVADIALDLGPQVIVMTSLSSVRAHHCTWNIPPSPRLTKTEPRNTWKGTSAPSMQRLLLPLLLPLPLLFLLSSRLLVASALLLFLSCLGFVQHKRSSEPTSSMKSLSYALALWVRCFGYRRALPQGPQTASQRLIYHVCKKNRISMSFPVYSVI